MSLRLERASLKFACRVNYVIKSRYESLLGQLIWSLKYSKPSAPPVFISMVLCNSHGGRDLSWGTRPPPLATPLNGRCMIGGLHFGNFNFNYRMEWAVRWNAEINFTPWNVYNDVGLSYFENFYPYLIKTWRVGVGKVIKTLKKVAVNGEKGSQRGHRDARLWIIVLHFEHFHRYPLGTEMRGETLKKW